MSLLRWGIAFLQLGAILLAVGLVPALFMVFFPATPSPVVALLSLSAAPLGALCVLVGALMWAIGWLRR